MATSTEPHDGTLEEFAGAGTGQNTTNRWELLRTTENAPGQKSAGQRRFLCQTPWSQRSLESGEWFFDAEEVGGSILPAPTNGSASLGYASVPQYSTLTGRPSWRDRTAASEMS